jgi:hypothetical protein
MNHLTQLIDEIESYVSEYDAVNVKFSTASVGWQIEHSMLTITKIIYALEKSDPAKYQWSFKLSRYIIFALGKIPRGKAKAPSVVMPSETISLDRLKSQIAEAKSQVAKLDSLPATSFFKHPYFGDLKLKQAIRMLEIHTRHHLSIIRDILR